MFRTLQTYKFTSKCVLAFIQSHTKVVETNNDSMKQISEICIKFYMHAHIKHSQLCI